MKVNALRLVPYFGIEAWFWLNLQTRYDHLCVQAGLDERLEKEVALNAAWSRVWPFLRSTKIARSVSDVYANRLQIAYACEHAPD